MNEPTTRAQCSPLVLAHLDRARLIQDEINALAEASGCSLRIEYDPDAPLPYAIWGGVAEDSADEDIIGAGFNPADAIADARETIKRWEPV